MAAGKSIQQDAMLETNNASGRRFLIVGLPRSGTTYLMTLLNSHKNVICAGELFNPYSIVEHGQPDFDGGRVVERDRAPRYFMKQFFERHEDGEWDRIGFKLMLGHNIRIMTYLPEMPDVPIIYVHRANRLAQVASYLKALQTKNWAQTEKSRDMKSKIVASPFQISHLWHEYAAMDFLFANWLKTLPHRSMTVEYCEMFTPGFNRSLCDFLGIPHDPAMKSPLLKQGANRVISRFEQPGPIEHYMRRIGRETWLEKELP